MWATIEEGKHVRGAVLTSAATISMAPPLPPLAGALQRMLSEREPRKHPASGGTPAAVLVSVFEGPAAQPHVWLLRRPKGMRVHSGQVALPGGKQEASDPDLVATALREAHEEIGLPPSAVRILGTTDDYVTSTGFVVTPVVGWIISPFTPMPNPSEASRVFCVPLSVFRDKGAVAIVPWEPLRGLLRSYEVDGEVIWGATAAILSALVTRVAMHPRMPGF